MILKDFIPAIDVQHIVKTYRIVHLKFEPGQYIPIKAYPPRPEQCLAFYPYDRETVSFSNGNTIRHLPVVFYGQFTEVTQRSIGSHFLVLQILFQPGALYKITGIPAYELNNSYLDATAVFKVNLNEVNEKLFHSKNYVEMIAILNQFVRTNFAKYPSIRRPIDDAFDQLAFTGNDFKISKLAQQSCLSLRQLERIYKERTGVNPKLYARINRFDHAFRLRNSRTDIDWLRIAVSCDYHDYQHLVKDYKDFTSLSPRAFHEIENNAPERKFGLSEGY